MEQISVQTGKQINTKKAMEFDIEEMLFLFRRKLWMILLAAIVGGVLTGTYTYFMVAPTYESTAQIYVVAASNDAVVSLSDLQIGSTLTSDFVAALKSRTVTERMMEELNLTGYSVEEMSEMISVSNPSDTRFVKITVTTTNPRLSAEIANKMSEFAAEWLPSLLACESPNIIEEAIPAAKKAAPSYTKAVVCGALVLAVLLYSYYLFKYVMDDSIRSDEDLEHYFGLVPIASIPEDYDRSDQKKHIKTNRNKKRG